MTEVNILVMMVLVALSAALMTLVVLQSLLRQR